MASCRPSRQPPGCHAALPSAFFFSECVHPALSNIPSAPLHLAFRSPACEMPRCRANAAGTKKTRSPAARSNPPPSPPEPKHSSTARSNQLGSAALRLHHFLLSPPGCRDQGSLVWRPRVVDPVLASASRDPAPRTGVNGAGDRGVGGAWVPRLHLPTSSSCRGFRASQAQATPERSESPSCAPGAPEIALPGCGRLRKPLSLARPPGAAALAKTHSREHGARSQKLVMSSVQREPHLLFF